ncbi:peptidase family m1 domain-containing protein [Ditylenchus destructor]|uniref:Peptidase family m1 domain-containing protein n=1 Tax=Ditylenchus destructor TaxID=166010 RepID=A0AAD4N583_9BILA|nr:peptidase family m1 domain-containing protein [Ditylenchus destructor]
MVEDKSSNANFNEVTLDHIALDWDIDFKLKRISGSVLLNFLVLKETDKIILDGRDLDIQTVELNGAACKYEVEDVGVLGQKIILQTGPLATGSKVQAAFKYKTTESCEALQFVEAELSSDKKQPFLYSQCQIILARCIVPCMDTPMVKQTYSAKVRVPTGIVCLMGALNIGQTSHEDGTTTFTFSQPIRIPSYLLSITAGALEKREISDRCAVWAEPSVVDKAKWEFEDTEKMLKAAEELLGKYIWGRYDMVVMPSFFPMGGMENPCMTFVTPTLLAGDRSATNVIAHEISHSWTGNLVTNGNWEHFWLNEGFTVFVERKIMGRLYGENLRDFEGLTGWEDTLLPTVNDVFHPNHEFTKLNPDLQGIDPDDAFSPIPYEKGSALLLYIEQKIGNIERFNEFLRAYITRFAQKSIVTDDFLAFLREFFTDKKDVLDSIDFNTWLTSPGIPPNKPSYDESLVSECRQLAAKWCHGSEEEITSIDKGQFSRMTADQRKKVLMSIDAEEPLSPNRALLLEKAYDLNSVGNCEVFYSWALVAVKAKWPPIIPHALDFLTRQGRMKYLKPVYKRLFAWEDSREQAIVRFNQNAPFMHPIAVRAIKALLKK